MSRNGTKPALMKQEERKVLAKVIEVAIRSIFANHVYRFDGQLYKKTEGGIIGLRLTGIVARIIMDRWSQGFLELMKASNISLDMISKYVNDVNLALRAIARGYFWLRTRVGGKQGLKLCWSESQQCTDDEKDELDEKRTMELL